MDYSPIALFCYKRIDTLKLCIKSLQQCPESKDTDLIIFSDTSTDDKELVLVEKVRDFIKRIDGFKSVYTIYRPINYGVDNNTIEGVKYMSENYDSFIVVEDDLVVSKYFLSFLNQALRKYEDLDEILTISAFNCVDIPKIYIWDSYFWNLSNPWGWATWSKKIQSVDWDLSIKENFSLNHNLQREFNLFGSDRSRMLIKTITGKIRAWDIRLDYYLFRSKSLTVYSRYNHVLNIGFNEQASNTFGYNRYKSMIDCPDLLNFKLSNYIIFNSIILNRLINKNSLLARLKTVLFKNLKINN